MDTLAVQTICAAKQAACPPIRGKEWTPCPLFSDFQGVKWVVAGKREVLNNKPGQPVPMLLGPLLLERCGQTEKKWTLSASLELPPTYAKKFEKMHTAFLSWLGTFYTDKRLFMSRWKSDYRGARLPAIRWWKAKNGKFERTTEISAGLILCTVDKFTRVLEDQRIFVELGIDIIVL